MINTLVSIAIPAYKAAFLKDAIFSVLNQTYSNIELIIVDDCSPENIEKIINEFNDSRIHYYRNTVNLGKEDPSKNWNKCLEYANGDFFALLCDDDTYEPTFVEEMLELSQEFPDVKVFRARARTIDENNNLINWYPTSPTYETCIDYMYQKMSGFRRQTISEFLYVTKYIKAHNGYVNTPRAWTADSLSIYKFAWENGIASTPKFLVNFKESKRNISSIHSDSLKKRDALIIFQKEIKDYIKKIPDKNQINMLNNSLYYCMYCEIIGLCTFSSFLDIFRILLKGGFPRKWFLFILVQKIGNLWEK
ncbi:glycosyltransferase family 2 protein [Fibrobacter sp. UWB7]|uniref:glycosyltransferase family 2 protein n=1 Tax=Fibrobacter sp. UWB7 TaxID=1896206 RepID=UPI00090EF481|nr:glycosyltransferase family 2 protein [Fibrobacter sp. UWB7]SHM11755.1 Glycosyl transferase family 2 [Fibrobacter sp. UWB7]